MPGALASKLQTMTSSTPTPSQESEERNVSLLYTSLRVFGLLVLVLMLASIAYSVWITLENWTVIGV
jgi:hypothetical protein